MNPRNRKWLLYWLAWLLLGVYMASMDLMMFPKARFIKHLLPMNILQNLAWGIAGLGVMAIARRWPVTRFDWSDRKNWAIELLGT
ncbi:MAG: hypothetical protein RL748_4078, partial [Pseudomonadota bacterium]